jgi:hypothetical protein
VKLDGYSTWNDPPLDQHDRPSAVSVFRPVIVVIIIRIRPRLFEAIAVTACSAFLFLLMALNLSRAN